MEDIKNIKQDIYHRAKKEYESFLNDLKKLPKEEILKYAYEIAMKEDILYIIETITSKESIQVLKEINNPIELIYSEWAKTDGCIIDMLENALNAYTDRILNEEAKELYQNPNMPLYSKNYEEAKESREVRFWIADRKRSEECLDFFNEKAVLHYHERSFLNFLMEWTKEFGLKRCKTILANIIKENFYDGRYEKSVKENASKVIIPNNIYKRFYSNVHPVIINCAYKDIIKMETTRNKTVSANGKKLSADIKYKEESR